jgi:hypothetical protein
MCQAKGFARARAIQDNVEEIANVTVDQFNRIFDRCYAKFMKLHNGNIGCEEAAPKISAMVAEELRAIAPEPSLVAVA